jgi:hypothetical protein
VATGIELSAQLIDTVADEGDDSNLRASRPRKRQERCGLHFDRKNTLVGPRSQLVCRFAIRCTRRPRRAPAHGTDSVLSTAAIKSTSSGVGVITVGEAGR